MDLGTFVNEGIEFLHETGADSSTSKQLLEDLFKDLESKGVVDDLDSESARTYYETAHRFYMAGLNNGFDKGVELEAFYANSS